MGWLFWAEMLSTAKQPTLGDDMCIYHDEKTLKFINDSQNMYGDLYQYDKVVYKTHVSPIFLFCKKHQEYFKTTPQLHLFNGGCCPICNNGFVTNECLTKEECQEKIDIGAHKHIILKYEYKTKKVSLTLSCDNDRHSPFEINVTRKPIPGCPQCKKETIIHTFLKNSHKLYGNNYDYSDMEYINNSTKIKILCNTHNEIFYQSPIKHLYGTGCPSCIKIKRIVSKRLTIEQFIEKSKQIHGDNYGYDSVIYEKNSIQHQFKTPKTNTSQTNKNVLY